MSLFTFLNISFFLLAFCIAVSWYMFRQRTVWAWFPAVTAAALALFGAHFGSQQFLYHGRLPASADTVVITIAQGATLHTVSRQLAELGLTSSPHYFVMLAQVLGMDRLLKAGDFQLSPGLSHYTLLRTLIEGKALLTKVTFPEGIRATDFAEKLAQANLVDRDQFLALVADSSFCASLGLPGPTADGYLLPETYFFHRGLDERAILQTLTKPVADFLNQPATQRRLRELDFTTMELATLASIVEGEAVFDSERAIIAAVYHNRLRTGIRLQADPTIQFIIDGPPRRLLYKDLEIASPYNTYLHAGLPPGPINNPGMASLEAALYPADVTFIFFVARGDGYHTFTNNQTEHLAAKRKFNKIRQQVKAQRGI